MNTEILLNHLTNGTIPISTMGSLLPVSEDEISAAPQSFGSLFNDAMTKLNNKQSASDAGVQDLVTGDLDNLHNLMIQTTEAQLSLELAIQLRNKGIEAYNELNNMQF